jgi:serine/threonine protein kinase
MGTPHYMSPEQCMGEDLDGRSDIYSLAVMLYEMLSGAVPFDAPTVTAIVLQQVSHSPAPLRSHNQGISPALESVVMHALQKRRESRPQTVNAFAQELVAAVYGGPPPKPVDRSHQTSWASNKTDPARAMADTVPVHTPVTPINIPAYDRGRNKLLPLIIILSVAVVAVTGIVIYLLVSGKDSPQGNGNRNSANRNVTANANSGRSTNNNTAVVPAPVSKFVGTWSEKWADINNQNVITIIEGTGGRPVVTQKGGWRVWDERLIGNDVLIFRKVGVEGTSGYELVYTLTYINDKKLSLSVLRVHDNRTFTGELYR